MLTAAANNALALSIGDLFWITLVSGALGLACCLMLRDRPLKTAAELRSGAIASGGDDAPQIDARVSEPA